MKKILDFCKSNITVVKWTVCYFFALWLIGHEIGYESALTSMPIILMAALLCCIMPANFMVVVCAGFILVHLYRLAPQYMLVALVVSSTNMDILSAVEEFSNIWSRTTDNMTTSKRFSGQPEHVCS